LLLRHNFEKVNYVLFMATFRVLYKAKTQSGNTDGDSSTSRSKYRFRYDRTL